ncbi:ABC transporter ATP-binding protein [Ancylobacter radicis]|uniref:ABC transporter ATP-binding protein n=1 Tax=Ancylobacter radicis TaxID=2836179 RepID=A0ABS5R682_9HYPH|nr:ABC transporter ATP-binding protein [Ancylobacter radicis]MBS9477174.1 ABC transporter ATP-binding protein [Ancylobacter radicis]
MSRPMLEIEGLDAWYGAARILFDLSLTVARGEAVALIGPNGAGKTTTMKAIMGLVRRHARRLSIDGQDVATLATFRIARLGVGYVPEDRRIFTDLTVAENLALARRPARAGAPAWDEAALFALFPNLAGMLDRPGGQMSGGEQQMLALARALVGNPALLLLDEPSEGVAPIIVEQMIETIRSMKARGLSILISEQNIDLCNAICDRTYEIEHGALRPGGLVEKNSSRPQNE